MEPQIRLLTKFPVFFDFLGSWIILFIILSLVAIEWLVVSKVKSTLVKWSLRITLVLINLILCSTLFMINIPLKPMISELAKVERLIGKPIPDFEFISVRDGKKYHISEFKSEVVIINYWATYCGPCVKELPTLKAIEETFGEGVKVIALTDEDEARVTSFLNKIEAPTLVGISKESFLKMNGFLPATVICKRGVISDYIFGQQDFEYFKTQIEL